MMPRPLRRISPSSSAIFTSTPGSGLPTVPNRKSPGRFTKLAALDSVSPYPSSTSTSAAWKNSAMSRLSGAPPETKNRIRPPNVALSFENTRRSATACWNASALLGSWPFCRSAETFRPTEIAHWKTLYRAPPASLAVTTNLL